MTIIDREVLWRQFGAAIDMFGNALRDCPDDLWEQRLWEEQPDQDPVADFTAFWYLGYHTLSLLDLYLSGAEAGFAPPAPFDQGEGEVPPRTYTRQELLGYLDYCRRKCQETIGALSHDQAYHVCQFSWGVAMPFVELQLHNLRHVQEHGAQLRMFLEQRAGKSTSWVSQAQ